MVISVHQTYLMVADLDRSVEFYQDVIGLQVTDQGDRRAEFETTEGSLQLEMDFDEEMLDQYGLEPPGDDRGRGVITVIEVESVEDVYDRAEEAGAEILTEPQEVEWGRKLFLVRDPDGYAVEVSRPL